MHQCLLPKKTRLEPTKIANDTYLVHDHVGEGTAPVVEVWWLSETVRLQAEADRVFGEGRRADELLAEAETLANVHGARLVQRRIAASRATIGS